jgi:RNA polymerase sigma-70 factor, ECF subfamily
MISENGTVCHPPLSTLFEEHASSLKRMLGTRSPQQGWHRFTPDKDLDDLIQEAFLCALAFSRRVPTLLVTRAYLFTLARNLDIDRWRRLRNRIDVPFDGSCEAAVTVYPDELATEREQREQTETLARYAEALPSQLARVYDARFVRALSQRNAATALGISRRRLRTLEQRLFAGATRQLRHKE